MHIVVNFIRLIKILGDFEGEMPKKKKKFVVKFSVGWIIYMYLV